MQKSDPNTPLTAQARDLLQEAMNVQGFNRWSLHRTSGVAHTTIIRILDGKISPKVDTLDKLFRAMNVEPHFSFD